MAVYGPEATTEPDLLGMARPDVENAQRLSRQVNDDFIQAHGVACELWEAIRCPCVYGETERAVPDCVSCKGTGRYYPEGSRVSVRALMTTRNVDRKQVAYGEDASGRVHVTLPTGTEWRHGYLILPTIETHLVNERLFRGRKLTDDAVVVGRLDDDLSIPVALEAIPERLSYPRVLQILGIYWGGGRSAVVRAREFVDYEMVGREVVWKSGRGPAQGEAYTVVYKAPAVYLLADPRFRAEHDIPLPPHCDATRFDAVIATRLQEG